jgi:hypothetical protein
MEKPKEAAQTLRVDDCEQELLKSTVRARPGNSPAELEDIPGMCAFEISTSQPACEVATGGNSEVDRKSEEKSESRQSFAATALPADKIVPVSREVVDKKAGGHPRLEAMRYDVFLSYRVAADAKLVESLYDKLKAMEVKAGNTSRMLRVFWDKVCLVAGEDYAPGFARALCNSRVVVIVMSRSAYQNIGSMKESSPCDNFILEHILTMELVDRKRLSAVLPVFVGDLTSCEGVGSLYTNFFQSGCLPNDVPNVFVSSIDQEVNRYLSELGMHLSSPRTVNKVLKDITERQGVFLEGLERAAVENAVKVVHECAEQQISMESDHTLLEKFQFSTPLGQEVRLYLSLLSLSLSFSPLSLHYFARWV